MSDWKERLKRMDEAAKKESTEWLRDRRSKCDRCGRRMSRASRYETPAGSIVCHICNNKKNIGG